MNCTDPVDHIIQYTYNFVTEWLAHKFSMTFYYQKLNFLQFTSNFSYIYIKLFCLTLRYTGKRLVHLSL